MKALVKRLGIALAAFAMIWTLAACSGGGNNASPAATNAPEASKQLHVTTIARFVDEGKVEALGKLLAEKAEGDLVFLAVSSGDPDGDPMGTMAGMAKIGAMFTSGEIEVLICDTENAQRYGAGDPEIFVPLATLLTQEEIDALKGEPVSIGLTDEEGTLTGEKSAPCGVGLSGNEAVVNALGLQDVNVFVVSSAKDMDLAKQVFLALDGLE
jgi:ABC-type glycerol-3-phosphate transport system substrate-binding protein